MVDRIDFHITNEDGVMAFVGDRIRRDPIVKDDMPLEGIITDIYLASVRDNRQAGITFDSKYDISLDKVCDFEVITRGRVYDLTVNRRNRDSGSKSSINDLLSRAEGNK